MPDRCEQPSDRQMATSLGAMAHVFNWRQARFHRERCGAGKRSFMISSSSGRLAARSKQRCFLWTSCAGLLARRKRRCIYAAGTQSLHLTCRMRRMLSLSNTVSPLLLATHDDHGSQPRNRLEHSTAWYAPALVRNDISRRDQR